MWKRGVLLWGLRDGFLGWGGTWGGGRGRGVQGPHPRLRLCALAPRLRRLRESRGGRRCWRASALAWASENGKRSMDKSVSSKILKAGTGQCGAWYLLKTCRQQGPKVT